MGEGGEKGGEGEGWKKGGRRGGVEEGGEKGRGGRRGGEGEGWTKGSISDRIHVIYSVLYVPHPMLLGDPPPPGLGVVWIRRELVGS